MWSRTDFSKSRKSIRVFFLLAVFAVMALSGCGYRLASDTPSVLGDGSKTLKVKGIESPTLHPWLPYAIRSRLRDEIGARYLARWVDSGPADYEIQVNVINFTTSEWIRTEFDTSQLYSMQLTLEAIVYEGSGNKEIWRSGQISYSEYDERVDERAASGNIITQVIRKLADTMRQKF